MIMGSEGGTSTAASSGLCFCFGSCRDYISPFSIQICLMWCFLTLFLYILICQLQFKALALLHPLWRWVSCLQFRVQVSFVYDYTHCILVVMIPSINYPPWSPDNWMKLFQLLYSYFVCHFFFWVLKLCLSTQLFADLRQFVCSKVSCKHAQWEEACSGSCEFLAHNHLFVLAYFETIIGLVYFASWFDTMVLLIAC